MVCCSLNCVSCGAKMSKNIKSKQIKNTQNHSDNHETNTDQSTKPKSTSFIDTGEQKGSIVSSLVSVIVVIGSALIIFAAARNTITWYFQRFWGASGDFWQAQWDKFLDVVGDDPETLWVYWTFIVTTAVYWIVGGAYTIMDITNKPKFIHRFKVQPGTNEPVETRKLLEVIGMVLFNQFILGFALAYFGFKIGKAVGHPPIRELPTFHWVLFELAILIVIQESGFYYSHRLFHHKAIYKYFHKKHHEWTAPIAITAAYAHPVEHIFANLAPIAFGVYLLKTHIATAWLWYTLATVSTLIHHSGYHLPLLPSPEYHDYHHLKFNGNYGTFGILDRLHGTDSKFRSSIACNRHITLLNTTPARVLFPDPDAKHRLGKQ